ncbi:peptidoglycan DD-metalloendopeptidase family protein [Sphingomonas sp. IC081]|uniref:peptidoglycan DD-metalloendopeptidase family protein n=1 Tax=Sphingomonas sp. IC081 TaxID=304378 RepID=UPI00115BDBD6|nr:peptidoglycan DD-metalloendopeptidase family protein [Sphingomonas sp. IC081]QDK34277.1 peptidase [Sphingomonas sp. IC081]
MTRKFRGALLGGAALAACVLGGASPAATSSVTGAVTSPSGMTYSGEVTQGGWIRGKVPQGTRSLTLDGEAVKIAPDGAWFAAFDRDARSSAILVATLADGRTVSRTIPVAPRAWRIENINIPRKPGGPSEAFMKIRQPELDRINAARARVTDAQGWRQHFIWPVKGRISGRFGSQRVYQGEPGAYHSGLDMATGTSGTPYVAPADGVVILAAERPFSLEGNLLMIDHGMGLNSAFLHSSQILVKEGDHVKQGQVIGRIGMTGRATGPHLHWSIKWNDARLDPILFTGPMP